MKGDWFIYCDICGQRRWASTATKLSTDTGKGGLIACKHDVDSIDYSLAPHHSNRREQHARLIRINHTDVSDSSPIFNYETDTVENISSYQYLTLSQTTEILVTSQDSDVWIATSQEI